MKNKLIAFALILLGSIQMIGDLANIPVLKGIGQATNASPAPKVFTAQKGYETFSKHFYLNGVEITPQNYQHLIGPYNRRNMYGAAISYAPVLASSEKTQAMFYSVAHFGLCNSPSILDEMQIKKDPSSIITFTIKARNNESEKSTYQQEFTFNCKELPNA